MSNLDAMVVALFIAMSALMLLTSARMNHQAYSNLLIGIICSSALITVFFQLFDVGLESASAAHTSIFALSQFATYGLASKLWLKINYRRLSRAQKITVHVVAHSVLLLFIVSNYWLRANLPLAFILAYPLCGFSISLMEEYIEKSLQQ